MYLAAQKGFSSVLSVASCSDPSPWHRPPPQKHGEAPVRLLGPFFRSARLSPCRCANGLLGEDQACSPGPGRECGSGHEHQRRLGSHPAAVCEEGLGFERHSGRECSLLIRRALSTCGDLPSPGPRKLCDNSHNAYARDLLSLV